jgi:hypothetical protein
MRLFWSAMGVCWMMGCASVPKTGHISVPSWQAIRQQVRQTYELHDPEATYPLGEVVKGNGLLRIPTHSMVAISLKSGQVFNYRDPVENKTYFVWSKNIRQIPYFSSLMRFLYTQPGMNWLKVFNVMNNLIYQKPYESYDRDEKAILLAVDPKAPLKISSSYKSRVGKFLKQKLLDTADFIEPGLSSATREAETIYRDVQEHNKAAGKVSSLMGTWVEGAPQKISGTPLFADTTTHLLGFDMTVQFWNPSDKDVEFNLSDYLLEPVEKDLRKVVVFYRVKHS